MLLPMMVQAQTLEECQRAAEQNYPLIRQYDLIEKTTNLTVANIQKGWLPQVDHLRRWCHKQSESDCPRARQGAGGTERSKFI